MELDTFDMRRGEGRHRGSVDVPQRNGPSAPIAGRRDAVAVHLFCDRLEQRVPAQRLPAASEIRRERAVTRVIVPPVPFAEAAIEQLHDLPFRSEADAVPDQLALAQPAKLFLEARVRYRAARGLAVGEFGHGLDIDIDRIAEQAARRVVRARMLRRDRREGVQGVEADDIGTGGGREFGDALEIGEIADTPVAPRADRIELHARAPHATSLRERRRLVAARRREDERCRRACGIVSRLQLEAVIPLTQRRCGNGKREPITREARAGDRSRLDLLQSRRHHAAAPALATLRREQPGERPLGERSWYGELDRQRHIVGAEHRDRREQSLPGSRLVRGQRRDRIGVGRNGNAHRGEQSPLRFPGRHLALLTNVEILRKNARECSQPAERVLCSCGTVIHAASRKYHRADQGSNVAFVFSALSPGTAWSRRPLAGGAATVPSPRFATSISRAPSSQDHATANAVSANRSACAAPPGSRGNSGITSRRRIASSSR